jgi:putative aminopeptidase FrvX
MDERTQFLTQITEAFGPPGLEEDVAALLRRRTEEFCDLERDNLGSFIARKKGSIDANRFQISGTGVPAMAICVPSRYIHSHSSLIDLRDYEAALRLLVAVVQRLDEKTVAQIRDGA